MPQPEIVIDIDDRQAEAMRFRSKRRQSCGQLQGPREHLLRAEEIEIVDSINDEQRISTTIMNGSVRLLGMLSHGRHPIDD